MDSIIHGFAGAGVISAGYFVLSFAGVIRNWLANRSETKAALAHDAERSKEQEIEDRVLAVVKDLMERKALPAPDEK